MAVVTALDAAGVDLPNMEARLLVGHGLGLLPETIFAHPEREVAPAAARAVGALAERRARGEPLAYIVGEREFWSLPIRVNPAVLIPRPDTERLVEMALDLTADATRSLRILDLGTGSGCILLALLSERRTARGVGIDSSEAALGIARDNASRLGLGSRCSFVCADWGAAVSGAFDLVVVNPPYIADTSFASLDRGVRCFEPSAALRGGQDGCDAFRVILHDLPRLIGARGLAVLEVGEGQADRVASLVTSAGLDLVAVGRDLAGRDRCLAVAAK